MLDDFIHNSFCYFWHGKEVMITPVESNWSLDVSQVILRNWTIVVLEVVLVTAPVIAMEPSCWFLLCIVEDGVGGGSSGRVVQNIREKGCVHLNACYQTLTPYMALPELHQSRTI